MSKSSSTNNATDVTAMTRKLLSAAWGVPVEVKAAGGLGGSSRSNVQRFSLIGAPADKPSSVVVKQALSDGDTSYDPDAGIASWRHFNEWATLQFLTDLAPNDPPCPRFILGDRHEGVVIMEDLGEVTQLDHLLLRQDAEAAREGLTALMTALGLMHGLTVGRKSAFDRLRADLNSWRPKFNQEDPVTAIHRRFVELSKGVEIEVDASVEDDIASLGSVYEPDNPFMALVHRDPCPDNCLMLNNQVKLIDFEFAEFRHALMDGVYGLVHFPTCWCVNRVPDDVVNAMSVSNHGKHKPCESRRCMCHPGSGKRHYGAHLLWFGRPGDRPLVRFPVRFARHARCLGVLSGPG